MKRIIAMLLVCLTLVQMLPVGIHTHAQETETRPVETTVATEETVPPMETTLSPETTEATEAAVRETAETVAETTVPLETEPAETFPEESVIPDTVPEETFEGEILLPEEFAWEEFEGALSASATYRENEPNDNKYQADLLEPDVIVVGTLGARDLDFFAFRLNNKCKVTLLAVSKRSTMWLPLFNLETDTAIAVDKTGTMTDEGNYSYTLQKTLGAGQYYVPIMDKNENRSYSYTYALEMLVESLADTCKHSKKKKQEVVEATCGSQGYTLYYCPTCELTWKGDITPATGNHIYDDEFDSNCNVCNYYRSVGKARGTCGSNLRWVLDENGVLTILGTGAMTNYEALSPKAPWDSYRYEIKSVDIREGVTSIGNYAFYFSGVERISLPNTLETLGDRAFAFSSLKSIKLPASFRLMYAASFEGCYDLVSFEVNRENPYFSNDLLGVLFNKNKTTLYLAPAKLAGDYTIPKTVTDISALAFMYSSLSQIKIPESVTNIEAGAFYDCSKLREITIPDGVGTIGDATFYGCELLARVKLPKNLYSIGDGAFADCTAITSITLPKSVTNIKTQAFWGCTALKQITFEGNAPTIGTDAFRYVVSVARYPITNTTWTSSKKQNYGGTLSWVGACLDGHVEIIDKPGVAPTCLEPGLSPDSHCANCGTVTSVQKVLPALGHDVVTDAYHAPTCLDAGITEGSHCGRCREVLVAQSEIPALGHDRVTDAYVAPLCEATGLTEGSHCGRCQTVFVAQNEIPALGHVYTDHWCNHCGRAEFVEVLSIGADRLVLNTGDQANLTAVLDYPIRPETEILWYLAEGDEAYVTLESNRDTAVLTAKRQMETRTVTVFAKSADGLHPAAEIQITLQAMSADQILFAGKSLTLKPLNMATGKAYTAKQLTWFMDEKYEPFLKMSNGKLTAQKVPEKVRTEVVATVNATGEKIYYVIDVYPVVTQVEVKQDGKIVNGKTIPMDYSDQPLTLTVDTYPEDTYETVVWSISDKKGQYADYIIEDDKLTISSPRGNSGTVTIKATVDAGVKKTVTVKVNFGSFAKEVKIAAPGGTTLRGGESLTLSAWVSRPAVVTKPGIVWSVSDKTVASVSGGKVTAKNVASPTTVTVTATSKDGMASNTIELKILPKQAESLVLMEGDRYVTNTTKAMNYGETWKVEAFRLKNGQVSPETVTWTSSKDSVAYVANGTITAIGVGTAKITAVAADGQKAVMSIKVATLVSEMKLVTRDGKNMIRENGEDVVLLSSGKSVNLTADIPTSGASKAVTWELTEGSAYAKLSASGAVSANKDLTSVAYATVKATAKDGSGVSASIRIMILPLATGIQIFESGSRVRTNTTCVVDMLTTPRIKLNTRVYPKNANQAVELTSSGKKIADFNENGELVCFMPGTVTITAKALDGSNQKVSFKLTIIKRVTDLTLKAGLPVDGEGNLFVAGGKSLKLAPMIQISPSDATNKKLAWSVSPNQYGITISSAGVLSTRKVPGPVTVNVMVTAQDGSGCMTSFDVTVYPA